MLGVVDGCLVSLPHDAGRLSRPAGSKSNGTGARGRGQGARVLTRGLRFFCILLLLAPCSLLLVPHLPEQPLVSHYDGAAHADVHVAPFAHFRFAVQVIVGHVHAAGIDHFAVDDCYLVVVAVHEVVYPWETQGVEGRYLYARAPDACLQGVGERIVAVVIAKAVEEDVHLHALAGFATKNVEKGAADAVLLELEVIHEDVLPRLLDRLEEVAELYLACWQNAHIVAFVERQAQPLEVALRALCCILAHRKQAIQQDEDEKKVPFANHGCKSTKKLGIKDDELKIILYFCTEFH